MISGTSTKLPSPCGLNCTYAIQFIGPYLLCDPSQTAIGIHSLNLTVSIPTAVPIYIRNWYNPYSLTDRLPTGSVSAAIFNATVLTPIGWSSDQMKMVSNDLSLHCKPAQELYSVNVTYQDGTQRFNIQADPDSIRELMDLSQGMDVSTEWPAFNLQWLSDVNNMAIIEAMTLALAGKYNVQVGEPVDSFNYTLNGVNMTL
jgi:hypothetical protein